MNDEEREAAIIRFENDFSILIRRFRKEINDLQGSMLTGHEFIFLAILCKKQPLMASALAKQLEVSPSYATMVVDKLIRKGLLRRQRSRTDRRIVELTVTEKGFRLYEELRRVRRHFLQKMFEKMNDEELDQLSRLLSKLI